MGSSPRPHVVIVGGGFGGLAAARTLRRAPVRVTVVDKRNHHLFQPLLYQVATAALSATDIASPIRKILAHQRNTTVLMARVEAVDPAHKRLVLGGGAVDYDYLILAAGMTNSYFGHDEWEAHAPGLKSLEEALEIRRRILLAYEAAERAGSAKRRRPWLTFVVIGGGPTGVELAGALAEIAQRTMTRNFRNFDPKSARVVLLEGGPRLLAAMPQEVSDRTRRDLEALGVDVRTETRALAIDAEGVDIEGPDGTERLACRTVLWGAGVGGVPLARSLGVELDRAGRVPVDAHLRVPALDGVYVVGDLARFEQDDGSLVPGVAQGALQMGEVAARNVLRSIDGEPLERFRYKDLGSMATIGRKKAVAVLGRLKLSGFLAWLAWLFVHLMALVEFRNRIVVLLEWAWAYLTYQRSARIILGRSAERTEAGPPSLPSEPIGRAARPTKRSRTATKSTATKA